LRVRFRFGPMPVAGGPPKIVGPREPVGPGESVGSRESVGPREFVGPCEFVGSCGSVCAATESGQSRSPVRAATSAWLNRFLTALLYAALRNEDRVARLQDDVVRRTLLLDHILEVELEDALFSIFHADDRDVLGLGPIQQSTRYSNELKNRHLPVHG